MNQLSDARFFYLFFFFFQDLVFDVFEESCATFVFASKTFLLETIADENGRGVNIFLFWFLLIRWRQNFDSF